MRVFLLSALLALAFASAGSAQEPGDAAAGEQVFRKCQACHSLQADRRTVGPHLQDVIGRTAGSVEGYPYSVVMRRSVGRAACGGRG